MIPHHIALRLRDFLIRRALAFLTLPLLPYLVSNWNCGKEFLFKASNLFGFGDEGDISFITLFIVICYIDNQLLTGALSVSNSCARLIKSVECMQFIPVPMGKVRSSGKAKPRLLVASHGKY